MEPPPRYLLDTNILIQFVRASPLWKVIRDKYQPLTVPLTPIISVVTHGELRSLATQWKWEAFRRSQVEYALKFFHTETIFTEAIIDAYAKIDAHTESRGRKLGKNDLWIAATAAATGACLLTTDRDFDHLCPLFFARDWIDPATVAA